MTGRMPNYVRLTINKLRGTMTEKAASKFLKKEGYVCGKFDLFRLRLGSIKSEQKKTQELRQLFLKWARDKLKENKEYFQRHLAKDSPEAARNQIEAEERFYEENIEFERIWGAHFKPIIDFLRSLREVNYTPDFIAKKENRVFIVEVKSKTKRKVAPLGEHQKKGLLKAYDYGFATILLVVPIEIEMELGEPYYEDLQ